MAALALSGGGDDDGRAAAPRTAAAPAPSPTAARATGEAVWVAQGCGSCHTLAAAGATGTIGPDLGATLRGVPPAAIRQSIVLPGAAAPPGWSPGAMPEDYASRMTRAELDRLVAYLDRAAG
jgi:cytochrome c oxidase subunit 2